jgi:hypothetical protein
MRAGEHCDLKRIRRFATEVLDGRKPLPVNRDQGA